MATVAFKDQVLNFVELTCIAGVGEDPDKFLKQIAGVIMMFDGKNADVFREFNQSMLKTTLGLIDTGCPILVLINKADLYEEAEVTALIDQIRTALDGYDFRIFHASVLTGANIDDGLTWLCSAIHSR